jgi:hypothetical protein
MNYPLRVMLALFLIGAFGGITIWRIVKVLQTRSLTKIMRFFDISIIILFMALLIAWVIFYWPVDLGLALTFILGPRGSTVSGQHSKLRYPWLNLLFRWSNPTF